MTEERLQKVLAAAGVASRRASERLIVEGRVRVNGVVVTELGTCVDPQTVQLTVDGRPVPTRARHRYLKLHKPRGLLSEMGGDTHGRETVAKLLPEGVGRVFAVGRLDLNSEGLMLLTDDGALAHQLTHPRFEHPKIYFVLVESLPGESALHTLRTGVDLPDGRTAPADVRVLPALPKDLLLAPGRTAGVWLEVVLREGKKRQIRHMTAAVGCPTLRLIRWAIGPLTLAGLQVGESRYLTRKEVGALRRATMDEKSARRSRKSAGPTHRSRRKR